MNPIYLDNLATTRLAPEARSAMLHWLDEGFGNAASSTHALGWAAAEAVEEGRDALADLLGVARSAQITFTSGATESNNTVVKGVHEAFAEAGTHVVTTAIEHPSILAPCDHIRRKGASVTVVPPRADGIVDPDAIARAIRPDTRLVTVMAANNEIGTLQPLAEIGRVARDRGVLFHVDAAQAVGKIELDLDALGIGALSVSAHKLHGPKGVGALYLAAEALPGGLPALHHGGGQELDRRAGTMPVAQIVGLGAAARLAREHWREDARRMEQLRSRLWAHLVANVPGLHLNGSLRRRLPGCLSFSVDGVPADALIATAPRLAMSSTSACSSHHGGGSHVLEALGLSAARQSSAVRIGLSRYTTAADVATAAELLVDAVRRLRGQRLAA